MRRPAAQDIGRGELPAAEEADAHPTSGSGVGLLALHGVEDRLAGVLVGPDRGQTGGGQLPALDLALLGLEHRVLHSMRAGFVTGVLAEEVVLLRGGKRGVAVGRADLPELVRIHTETRFDLEATLERFASVLPSQHLVGLGLGDIEVADVPGLVIGELVVRREQRMGFAVSLDLRRLVERLPLGALGHVLLVELRARSTGRRAGT